MSKYKEFKLDEIKDYPLKSRSSKVNVDDLAQPLGQDSLSAFANSLPRILAGWSTRSAKQERESVPLSGDSEVMWSRLDSPLY